MSYVEDVDIEYQLALFFDNMSVKVEQDYVEHKISFSKRNKLLREIRLSRNETMCANDALIKNNIALREVAHRLLKLRD